MVTRPRKKGIPVSSSSPHGSNISKPSVNHPSSSMPGHPHASLPHNEHDTNNGKLKPHSPPTSLHRLFSLATSTSFTLTSIAAILLSPLLDGDAHQPTVLQCAFGYLFVARPLLSTLALCLGTDDRSATSNNKKRKNAHERVIAASFLAAIVSKQLPKWASCAMASSAVLAFGLASRQFTARRNNKNSHAAMEDDDEVMQDDSAAAVVLSSSSSSGKDKHTPSSSSSCNNNSTSSKLQQKWSKLTLKEKAALATLAVVTTLLLENFLIWVVSATYPPGIHGTPTPLQDNGRIVLESFVGRLFPENEEDGGSVRGGRVRRRRLLQTIRDGLNVQWGIVAGLGASFVCLELEVGSATRTLSQQQQQRRRGSGGRSLAGLALHALLTLSTARLIRTVSFVLTVVPSQMPDCYRRHFPHPPPESWMEWVWVGFLPNSRGGCNDLILSGHATVLTTLGCACTSVVDNGRFSGALWTLVAVDFAIEAYQGLHYSVDMWLGCIVTCLLWQLTKGLEGEGDGLEVEDMEWKKKEKVVMAKIEVSPTPLDGGVVALYSLPAFLGFILLTFVSEAVVNYFLVGYAIWAGIIFAKWGFTNFSQHILLCLLFVTLGSYL
ncbi:hypothetical protein HJC23_003025 [Cyclotella cryptica]|uniref:Sphingomyelin synthase-like domain-containing protein n=1 Tax=Cyclotella cryptica TaxID=29204 RepID=A0ABD3PTH0_9STRA|eukprot:CCRYP_011823-RA/>CCRYP_011823-RA protein AED:0.20 eAED:0.20 QI:187/-1/1/1/-1/1/1/575/606